MAEASTPSPEPSSSDQERYSIEDRQEVLSTNLVAEVRAKFHELSRAHRKVAQILLESPQSFITLSVREAANASDVSQAAVVRFARSFGCAGFRDLKFRLAQDLAARKAVEDFRIGAERIGFGNYTDRICASATLSLRHAISNFSLDAMERAAQMITSSRSVVVFGLGGSSSGLAGELHDRLFQLGIASAPYLDTCMQRISAATLDRRDVALMVSSSGRAMSLIENAEIARHYGAKTIAITDIQSPLARKVDVCLDVRLIQVGAPLTPFNPMRYAQLMVVDCLAYRIGVINGQDPQDALERVTASIASVQ